MIADPMCLFDCCLNRTARSPVWITSAERARDLRQRPVYIHAAAQGMGPNASIMTNYYKPNFLEDVEPLRRATCGSAPTSSPRTCAAHSSTRPPRSSWCRWSEFGLVEPGAPVRSHSPATCSGRTAVSPPTPRVIAVGGVRARLQSHLRRRAPDPAHSTCQVADCESVPVTSGAGVPKSRCCGDDSCRETAHDRVPEAAAIPRCRDPSLLGSGRRSTSCACSAAPTARRSRFPPGRCPACNPMRGQRVGAHAGTGTIYSWIVVHPPVLPAFADDAPYSVVPRAARRRPGAAWSGRSSTSRITSSLPASRWKSSSTTSRRMSRCPGGGGAGAGEPVLPVSRLAAARASSSAPAGIVQRLPRAPAASTLRLPEGAGIGAEPAPYRARSSVVRTALATDGTVRDATATASPPPRGRATSRSRSRGHRHRPAGRPGRSWWPWSVQWPSRLPALPVSACGKRSTTQ